MEFDTSLPTAVVESNWLGISGLSVWWLLFGVMAFVSAIFFFTIVYHWLRYETNNKVSYSVIALNAVVLLLLLGSAATTLNSYLVLS